MEKRSPPHAASQQADRFDASGRERRVPPEDPDRRKGRRLVADKAHRDTADETSPTRKEPVAFTTAVPRGTPVPFAF